jgi:hypothetical protein
MERGVEQHETFRLWKLRISRVRDARCLRRGTQSQVAPSQLSGLLVDTDMSGAAHTGVVTMHPDRGRSWMAPGAGTLTGFHQPDGACSDKKGDVWIVNNEASPSGESAVEYKHGGKKPIAILETGPGYAVSCSVDPTTGNPGGRIWNHRRTFVPLAPYFVLSEAAGKTRCRDTI